MGARKSFMGHRPSCTCSYCVKLREVYASLPKPEKAVKPKRRAAVVVVAAPIPKEETKPAPFVNENLFEGEWKHLLKPYPCVRGGKQVRLNAELEIVGYNA